VGGCASMHASAVCIIMIVQTNLCLMPRVGHNHISTVRVLCLLQVFHLIYGQARRIYTFLADRSTATYLPKAPKVGRNIRTKHPGRLQKLANRSSYGTLYFSSNMPTQ
jgi:hypothetical protein